MKNGNSMVISLYHQALFNQRVIFVGFPRGRPLKGTNEWVIFEYILPMNNKKS